VDPHAKIQCALTPADGGALVKIAGVVDADFRCDEVEQVRGVLVVDLDGVNRITSFGIREWTRFLKRCVADTVVFTRVRPTLVAQFNVVVGFGGRGVMASCYLPYVCPHCGAGHEELLDLAAQRDVVVRNEPPAVVCSQCRQLAEFDELPTSYFAWVAERPAPVFDELTRRIMNGECAPAPPTSPLTIKKEVAEDVTGLWLSGSLDKEARLRRVVDGIEGFVVVVCAGVTDVDEVGVSRLVDLVGSSNAMVMLARVSVLLLRTMVREKRALLEGRVCSLLWKTGCRKCGRATAAEMSAPFSLSAQGTASTRCFVCGTNGQVSLTEQQREMAAFVLAPAVPVDLAAYLATRPGSTPPAVEVDMLHAPTGPQPVSRYRIVRPLAVGGMAEVFLAEQKGPEGFVKKVVLKRILPHLSHDEEFLKMFLQEARLAARINHPNVVQIFDLGQEGNRAFMAMEYVRGWDLREVLKAVARGGHRIPVEVALRIAADLCSGLHAAHTCTDDEQSAGIVHRDVSPHNVLLSDEGAVKITDFGISKAAGGAAGTKSGIVKGKLHYMAPEQIEERLGPVDAASDVFAAGLILREMLTGIGLFRRDHDIATMRAVLSDDIPPLVEVRPDAGRRLSEIVGKAIERDRTRRYASALAFALDLEQELLALGRVCSSLHLARWLQSLPAGTAARQATTMTGPTATPGFHDSVELIVPSGASTLEGKAIDDGSGSQHTQVTLRITGSGSNTPS
jgi:serine/threonine protein kinase